MQARFIALPTAAVRDLLAGAPDANGLVPERSISDGDGNPCRHCLREIPAGAPMLILAWRPFTTLQPYAEVGPVFLCAEACARHPESAGQPALYRDREMLIRGYDADERIIYGSGRTVSMAGLEAELASLFELPGLAFVHARSPTNNCYHFRIEPATD
ncbi:MAG TPA: DUF1203 domain-containing protein [Gammaproteobacteria bacterium]|nr:DUF1203 domain-containing protein [Gammaproteobacteria bacterium]